MNQRFVLIPFFLFFLLAPNSLLYGQTEWAEAIGGSSSDQAYAIVLDNNKNIYVTGSFQGTSDFDPSGNTANLTSTGNNDVFVAKYDSNGNYVWAVSFGSSGYSDYGRAIALDASNNVYVGGFFAGTVDFDPSGSTANITSNGNYDGYILKLSSSGSYVWAVNLGGANTDRVYALDIDGSGNVYSTGQFYGTADFDPSGSTANLTTNGSYDGFVCKLNSSGTYVWAMGLGGSSSDYGYGIAIDGSGNVHTIGTFQGTADFDPSGSTANLTSNGSVDVFVSKLNSSGTYVWAKNIGGTSSDYGYGIAVDGSSNVYSSGYFNQTADFDPSGSTSNLVSNGGTDIFVQKMNSSGTFQWAQSVGSSQYDYCYALAIDGSNNVCITGTYQDTVDFDPSGSTYNLISSGSTDAYILSLNSSGDFLWASSGGGSGSDNGRGVYSNLPGSAYCTGYFNGTSATYAGNNISPTGSYDVFIWHECEPTTATINPTSCYTYTSPSGKVWTTSNTYTDTIPNSSGCDSIITINLTINNSPETDSTFSVTACESYTSPSGKVWTSSSTYQDTIANAGGCDSVLTITLTVNTSTSSTIDVSTCHPYTAPSGNNTWSVSGSYSDVVTNAAGCDSNITINLIVTPHVSQQTELKWYGTAGSSSSDGGEAVATDNANNVYITGDFTGTVDFDLSSGTSNLTSAGNNDIFIAKYDSTGDLIWAKNVGGTSFDIGRAIAVDDTGNVYITGQFQGTADFDPSGSTANLTSNGNYDVFIAKYDSSGNYVWAGSLGSSSYSDNAEGIALDASNNVYVGGFFAGTVDFDPSGSTANLTSNGNYDGFILKLSSAGSYDWSANLGGANTDRVYALDVDGSGNVYSTGQFYSTADFDPSGSTANVTSSGAYDGFVCKLNSSGAYVWAMGLGGSSSDYGYGIAVDALGNVHTIGTFQGTADFDPSGSTANITSNGSVDVFVSKLNSSGTYVWAKNIGGTSSDYAYGIAVDASSNVYSSGHFNQTADFDPSGSTFELTSNGGTDVFIQKMDSSGSLAWAKSIGGTSHDYCYTITADQSSNVYAVGNFQGTADFDPEAGSRESTSNGSDDIFIVKLVEPTVCTSSNSLPTTLSTTFTGSYCNTDTTTGWTFYCGSSDELLLGLKMGTSKAIVNADEVQLKLGSATTYTSTGSGGMILNTDGYAIIDRRWDVSPTTQPSNGNVGVQYYFTNSEYGDLVTTLSGLSSPSVVDSVQQLQMYKATSGAAFADPHTVNGEVLYHDQTPSTVLWTHSTHGSNDHIAEFEVASFSGGGGGGGGGGGSGASPLPVKLIDFTARAIDRQNVRINWSTSMEINNSHFILERSFDGVHFGEIHYRSGQGTTLEITEYEYLDDNLIPNPTLVYYRLAQYDFDGTRNVGPVRKVTFGLNNSGLSDVKVAPNPFNNVLHIVTPEEVTGEVNITIHDLTGKMILNQELIGIKGYNTNSIDVSHLLKGTYFVTVSSNGVLTHHTLVKNE